MTCVNIDLNQHVCQYMYIIYRELYTIRPIAIKYHIYIFPNMAEISADLCIAQVHVATKLDSITLFCVVHVVY